MFPGAVGSAVGQRPILAAGPRRSCSSDCDTLLEDALSHHHPELTTASEHRKTLRATCMRDLRQDPMLKVAEGRISLRRTEGSDQLTGIFLGLVFR